MALARSIALLVLLVASSVGWWSGRRLPVAANLELLRRRAGLGLAAGSAVVASGAVYVGAGVPQWVTSDQPMAEALRVALIGVPVLVTWAVTIPRTWSIARSRRSADPLHWPDGRLRLAAARPELVVPYAATLLGTVAVLLLPSAAATPSLVQVSIAALVVTAATGFVGSRQRQHRDRVANPFDARALV
jgi:hypothetical protein